MKYKVWSIVGNTKYKILNTKYPKFQGFSLIELLVVITIISILVSFGTVAFTISQKKARDSRRKNDLKNVKQAMEFYYSETGHYPFGSVGRIVCSNDGIFDAAFKNWGTEFFCTRVGSGETVSFIEKLPMDPKGTTHSTSGYRYDIGGSGQLPATFTLSATLENTNDPEACVPDSEDCLAKIGCVPYNGATYKRNFCVKND